MKRIWKQFLKESLQLMKHEFITCILKQNSSLCNGNIMAHPLKKFRTQPSARNIMATLFWGLEAIFLVDYMPMALCFGIYKRPSRKNVKGR
jgi:hypothetical protein